MLKNKKKVLIITGIATVLLIGLIAVLALNPTKQETIELEFKKEIVVEQNEKLTTDILIEKSNADKVTIKDGTTDKLGKIKITVTAVKGKATKDFSTEIKVEKAEADKDNSKKSEEKKEPESDETDENSSNEESANKDNSHKTSKSDKTDNKDSNSSGSNSSDTGNKNTSGGSSESSGNTNSGGSAPSQPQQPVQPELTEAQFASQVYALINNYRTGKGFPAFSTNGTIQSIANLRANDMAQMGYASHNRPDGTSADYFWVADNYGIESGGENVFGGSLGFLPEAVVNSFIASPGHERLFVADYNQYMGVGVRYSGGQVFVSVDFQQ